MNESIDVSAVVTVGSRYDRTGKLAAEYLAVLKQSGKSFELIFVLDGEREKIVPALVELAKENPQVRIFQLSRPFGEAAALTAGFEHANGKEILTLPAYYQVDSAAIGDFLASLDGCDLAIAVRWPRAVASRFEKFRRDFFHRLLKFFAGEEFRDLGCSVRLMNRQVVDEVPIYGDQDRFLPLLASRRGFRVREVEMAQSDQDRTQGKYGPKTYLRRLLDIFTVFFLVKFTKKPLRFFGMIGSVTAIFGGVFLTYVVVERLFFGVALAERPALLLSSLLVVLGLQMFALGLLGELIIFTHARDIKEYTIEKNVN